MRLIKHKLTQILVVALLLASLPFNALPASAAYQCGKGENAVKTTIDFGCVGDKCNASAEKCNAIIDVTFAVIRFLSAGVGLFIVGSLIFAGIQFASSRGDPKASEMAQARIQNTLIALLIFIFAWAMINYVVPKGILGI